MAQHPVILQEWFDLFQRYRTLYNVKNENIYNMDEKGFLQGVIAKLRVIIDKNEANRLITQPGSREWTSLIECVSMAGRKLRPWIIFKGVLLQKAWLDAYKEAHFTCTENGWTNNEIGLLWLQQCFDVETAVENEYRMLCVDGHASHISTKAIEFCVQKKIILLCLPAHTTHILQPLDVGVFGPLATAYKNDLHETTKYGAGFAIDKVDFLLLLEAARERSMTELNIQKAWAKAGLEPYDPSRILHQYRDRANPALTAELAERHYNMAVAGTHTPPESSAEPVISCETPGGRVRTVFMTPHNGVQVRRLLEQAIDMPEDAVEIARKVGKSAVQALANATLLGDQTEQLMGLVAKKDSKKQRQKGALSGAIVMNQEVLDDRRLHWDWDTAFRRLGDIHLNVCQNRRSKSHEVRKARWEKAISKLKNPPPRKPRFFRKKAPSATSPTESNASPTKLGLAASPTKKSGPIVSSTKLGLAVSPTKKSGPIASPTKPESATPSTKSESAASPTKKKAVEKKKRLLVSLPIRVSNQDLQHGRWRRQCSDLIGQSLGQGQRNRRPPTRM